MTGGPAGAFMGHAVTAAVLVVLSCLGCSGDGASPTASPPPEKPSGVPPFTVEALKWFAGKKGAVSITYDALWGQWRAQERLESTVRDVLRRGLRIDFEFVTAKYDHPDYLFIVEDIRDRMIPAGVHFYGHGHTHVPHDSLSFDEAFASFSRCYGLMEEWGLRPRAYSYPYGSGRRGEIQRACEDAGFICARGVTTDPALYYICPGETAEPENWFYLPTVPVAGGEPGYVASHAGLAPILDEAEELGAWVILMYHAVGFPDEWGYYPVYEFVRDIDRIAAGDAWCGNMDAVACYIRERNAFTFETVPVESGGANPAFDLVFRDGLDNGVFDQPLTLRFDFDDSVSVREMHCDPPLGGLTVYPVIGNEVTVNAVPDEKTRRIRLYIE